MNTEDYQKFTDQLCSNVLKDNNVLGLVALGSMANEARRDTWSDHDFFLIVRSGEQEKYRQNLDWLPDHDTMVLKLRETEHGLKVMFANGHLIEFAVFDQQELFLAKVNDYAVLVDKANVTEDMTKIKQGSESRPTDAKDELLFIIGLLQVGSGRYARGEKLSGHIFIKSYALSHLLALLNTLSDSPDKAKLDNLDPFRRFERVYPALGEEINALLLEDVIDCASGYLSIIEKVIQPQMADFPQDAINALRKHLEGIRSKNPQTEK